MSEPKLVSESYIQSWSRHKTRARARARARYTAREPESPRAPEVIATCRTRYPESQSQNQRAIESEQES